MVSSCMLMSQRDEWVSRQVVGGVCSVCLRQEGLALYTEAETSRVFQTCGYYGQSRRALYSEAETGDTIYVSRKRVGFTARHRVRAQLMSRRNESVSRQVGGLAHSFCLRQRGPALRHGRDIACVSDLWLYGQSRLGTQRFIRQEFWLYDKRSRLSIEFISQARVLGYGETKSWHRVCVFDKETWLHGKT